MSDLNFELLAEIDADGFIALVSPEKYDGFIGDDWTLEQLMQHFLKNLNAGTLFVAHLGTDLANEPLRFSNTRTPVIAWREASAFFQVGQDGIRITDYTQLTMAAQFPDEPPSNDTHPTLSIPPGVYQVTLRQFAHSFEDGLVPAAELILESATPDESAQNLQNIPWWEIGQ